MKTNIDLLQHGNAMNIVIDFLPYLPSAIEIEYFCILLHQTRFGRTPK